MSDERVPNVGYGDIYRAHAELVEQARIHDCPHETKVQRGTGSVHTRFTVIIDVPPQPDITPHKE